MEYRKFRLAEIQKLAPDIQWHNYDDRIIAGVTNDSRKVTPGCLFIALSGTKTNGSLYISDAIAKGAAAIIASELQPLEKKVPFGVLKDPERWTGRIGALALGNILDKMQIAGVTGTNGKTTTTYFIRSILQTAGYPTGLIGTTGYMYGQSFFPAPNTTPDSLVLNEHFTNMVDRKIFHAVMEVSSHSLVQHRVDHLRFHTGVFTNLGRDHLDYHLTIENYRNAKGILFAGLDTKGYGVFNNDDPATAELKKLCKGQCLFFGLEEKNKPQIYAKNIRLESTGSFFTLVTPEGTGDAHIQLPGLYNIYNALAASACAWTFQIPVPILVAGISSLAIVPGRMERIDEGQPFTVLVDYAHTSQALEAALATLKQTRHNRLLLVFGCGGDRDSGKRPMMGKAAEHYADFTWITNDNPRSESPEKIAKQITEGFTTPQKYDVCLDRGQAIERAVKTAQNGDIVLIAGKGHETGQIIGSQTFPFDDRVIVRQCLQKSFSDHSDKIF